MGNCCMSSSFKCSKCNKEVYYNEVGETTSEGRIYYESKQDLILLHVDVTKIKGFLIDEIKYCYDCKIKVQP